MSFASRVGTQLKKAAGIRRPSIFLGERLFRSTPVEPDLIERM